MKRATAWTLVMAAAFPHGVTAAGAAASGGLSQRWDCVAFAAAGDIYIINLDGTGLTRLTADDDANSLPVFSPDGTKIAYVRFDRDIHHWAVYVMNADGTDKRRLSPSNDVLDRIGAEGDCYPVFAPDGERLAVERSYKSYKTEYQIIFLPTSGGPEGNFRTKIEDAWERERYDKYESAPTQRNITSPVFSGDGRKIVFCDYHRVSGWRLWIANADGSGAHVLVSGIVHSYALSPDGTKLAFNERVEEGWRLCVINVDGTGERLLAESYPGSPDWSSLAFSADGEKIVYESNVGRWLSEFSDIYTMNADGSERRGLTRTPEDVYEARFTPDGSKIVFSVYPFFGDHSPESGIYVINADGSGRRFLVAGVAFSLGPSLVEGRLLDSYGNWHDVVDGPEATPPGE